MAGPDYSKDYVSTSALARLLDIRSEKAFSILQNNGYLKNLGGPWLLTPLGKQKGGKYGSLGGPAKFPIWPRTFTELDIFKPFLSTDNPSVIMKGIIDNYCIKCIWHFTDLANIESIKRHGGLFSLKELERRNIVIPSPGGNALSHSADKSKGMDEFVHLCFRKDHPMAHVAHQDGRINKPVWLQIDETIMLDSNVRFTPGISNKRGVPVLNHEEAKKFIDFDVIYKNLNWRTPEIKLRLKGATKAEILVPKFVPIKKIRNL